MEYREIGKTGCKVSPLGFGMMRLPLKEGGQAGNATSIEEVDVEKTIEMVHYAIDHGINYIDTAFNYVGGNSEKIVGQALAGGYRDKVYLATKSPTWMYKTENDFDSLLAKQLERLQTDHIDFYLLHSLNGGSWKRCKKVGAVESMIKAKEDGRVKHIGFSFHDDFELFEEVLDAADWDFCQIQLNYYDQEFQAGLKGLQLAAERGLGVVIMEPLRGGFLVDLPPKVQEVLDKATDKSPVELAFDWLWNMPEVSTVLSGMSSMEMLQEDIAFAEKAKPGMLSAEDTVVIEQLRESFNQFSVVPCTGCNYCVEYCPEKIVIPYNFTAYNMRFLYDNMDMAREYYQVEVPKFGRTAENCTSCGSCEEICPQHIAISSWMPKIDMLLGED